MDEARNVFEEAGKLSRDPNLFQIFVEDIIGKRVKRDYPTKISCFVAGLSAYTPQPINLFLKKETSGIGATYNATRSLLCFPKEDKWLLGGLSPTALVHLHGVLMDEGGSIIEEDGPSKEDYADRAAFVEARKLWRERMRGSYNLIDLSGKILIFLEAPHPHTFKMLYPILSHDSWEISYKITDKTSRGKLRTMHTVLRGWPATIFCGTNVPWMEEFSTRCFTATPEITREKIGDAQELIDLLDEAPWTLGDWDSEDEAARKFILNYRANMKEYAGVAVPFRLWDLYVHEVGRDMRDYEHFKSFIKVITALHFCQRPILEREGKRYLLSVLTDVEIGRRVFFRIFETTRSGLSQQMLDFYHEVVRGGNEWEVKKLVAAHNEAYPWRKRSTSTIRHYLKELETAGYVNEEPHPTDKRMNVYTPIITEKLQNVPVFKNEVFSASDFGTQFKLWLDKYCKKTRFYIYNFSGEPATLSAEEATQKILSSQITDFLKYLLREDSGAVSRKEAIDTLIHQTEAIRSFSGEEVSVGPEPPSWEADLDLKLPLKRLKLNLRFEKIHFCHCGLCGRASYDAYRCYGLVKDDTVFVCGKCKAELEGKEVAEE